MLANQALLLKSHRDLDTIVRTDRRRCFVSGWHVENPLASEYLDAHDLMTTVGAGASKYQFLSDSRDVSRSIIRFHRKIDRVEYAEGEIFVAPGSSPLILAVMTTLHRRGVRRICYFPPVYYAFFYWASVFGIEMVPVTQQWPALDPVDVPLPPDGSVLLFSDPAWVVGRFLDAELIQAIARWQSRTGSLVVVDGTFQYTKWDPAVRTEFTSHLDKRWTLRMVCPTKALGVNGIRFAYLLLPAGLRDDIRYVASNSSGASDGFSVAAASRVMDVLNGDQGNARFVACVRARSDALTGVLHQEQAFQPTCTYYVFAPLLARAEDCITMDGRFFEGPDRSGVRINLMLPQAELDKLSGASPSRGGEVRQVRRRR